MPNFLGRPVDVLGINFLHQIWSDNSCASLSVEPRLADIGHAMTTDQIRREAVQELHTLREKCREIEAFLTNLHRYGAKTNGDEASQREAASTLAIFSAVHDIIEEAGEPVLLRTLYEKLVQRGVAIGGRDPRHNLAQKLYAEKQFKAYGRRGWYFSDRAPKRGNSNPRHEVSGQNEKDPDDIVAGSSQPVGSEQLVLEAISVPSGRGQSGSALVPSAPQPRNEERETDGLASHH